MLTNTQEYSVQFAAYFCQENSLLSKTDELMDFSMKQDRSYHLLKISEAPMERLNSFW